MIGDELSIGAYEIRVSHEVSQPQPVAPVAPLAGGRPEFESYAQTPSGGAVPDIIDLVTGTSAETDPFPPQAAERKVSAEPDHWPTAGPPEEGPRIPETEREPSRAPVTTTDPDHTPGWNASYNPPEAIPEDYDIWADTSRPQPGAQDLPIGAPESPPAPIVPGPASAGGGPGLRLPRPPPNPAPREGQPALTPPANERIQKTRPAPTTAGEADALQAFFAGLDAGELPADRQAQAKLMRTTGRLLRVMTEGLTRVLMGQTNVKNELRPEMIQIRPMENNSSSSRSTRRTPSLTCCFIRALVICRPWKRPMRPSTTSSAMRWYLSPAFARRAMRCRNAWIRRNWNIGFVAVPSLTT